MKKIFENKILLVCFTIILLSCSVLFWTFILRANKDNDNNDDLKLTNNEVTNEYIAYIKINPLIKIEYTEKCKDDVCENPVVTKFELINEDAKTI